MNTISQIHNSTCLVARFLNRIHGTGIFIHIQRNSLNMKNTRPLVVLGYIGDYTINPVL